MMVELLPVLPLFITAVLMAGLAFWLLAIDFNKPAHRGFALVLLFRAGQILIGLLRAGFGAPSAHDPSAIAYLNQIVPYIVIPVVPAIIYFASQYPQPRGPFAGRTGTLVLVGVTVAAEVAYFLDHTLFYTIVPEPASTSLLNAGRGFSYSEVGPLFLFNALVLPTTGVLAYIFARDYAALEQGSRRYSAFLVCLGFTLNALFDGTFQLTSLYGHYTGDVSFPLFPWGWSFLLLPSLTILPAAAAVWVMFRALAPRTTASPRTRHTLAIVGALPIATALWVGLSDYAPGGFLGEDAPTIVLFSVLGVWRLTLPALVAYALLRYHLFGIDVRAKQTIQYGGVAIVFTLMFFAVGELAEAMISDRWSSGIAVAATAALAIAFKPLEQAAERFAHRLLPGAKPLDKLSQSERLRVFGEQFSLAVQDGKLTAKERAMLLKLQRRLGLMDSEAGVLRVQGRMPS